MTLTRAKIQTAMLALLIVATQLSCAPKTTPSPHIFVYLIDTLRADRVGCYGYERDTTPIIDAFAEEAFRFAKAYSPSPWTRPAVASLFTGAPPSIHGVRGRNGWAEAELTTWAERLKLRGYATAAHFVNGNLDQRYGLGQGFDEYVLEEDDTQAYLNSLNLHERWVAAMGDPTAQSTQPMFQYLHSMDPHIPFSPQRRFMRPFVRDDVPWRDWFDGDEKIGDSIRIDYNRYNGEIRQSDHSFGLFLEELRARGLYENSWIVLVADHGEEFREHGIRGHGHGHWESLLRVPLIVRPPGGKLGSHAARLEQWVDSDIAIHALPDLIGGSEWDDWESLGIANAAWTGLPAEALAHWIPTVESPAHELRRASFLLDGKGAVMVARGKDKLIWQDFQKASWRQIDSDTDRFETNPSDQPDPTLLADMSAWFNATRRGYGLSFDGPDSTNFRLRPDGAFRGAHLYPGEFAGSTWQHRSEGITTILWDCPPGGRIVLERDVDQGWLIDAGDAENPEWVELTEATLEGFPGLSLEVFGGSRASEALPPPMSEELHEQLKALGYVD